MRRQYFAKVDCFLFYFGFPEIREDTNMIFSKAKRGQAYKDVNSYYEDQKGLSNTIRKLLGLLFEDDFGCRKEDG